MVGQVGAARLLFGMGRDGILVGKIFSHLNEKKSTPVYNILIIGVLTINVAMVISYQKAAELPNFGAILAFLGVNIASFRTFFFQRPKGEKRNIILDVVFLLLGFSICFTAWISLPNPLKLMGGGWFLIGFIQLFIKTKRFTENPSVLEFGD